MRRTHLTLYLRGFFFIALLVYIFHIITFTGLCISYYYIYWFIYFILLHLLVYLFHIITFTGLYISYYYIYWFIYFILLHLLVYIFHIITFTGLYISDDVPVYNQYYSSGCCYILVPI
jgi:hypothetical protein